MIEFYATCGHKWTKENPHYLIVHSDEWHGGDDKCICVQCEQCLFKYWKFLKIRECIYLNI